MSNVQQVKLINTELNRPFYVAVPEFISRKMLSDIRPILDALSSISRNLSLEKYFTENSGILEYISMTGKINAVKIKEVAEQLGLDPTDKKSYAQCEDAVRAELMVAYPGIVTAMKSYDIVVNPNDDEAWKYCVQLIKSTGVVKQEVDKEMIDKNDDPNGDFWQNQSVEEVGHYAQFFRKYCS